MNRIFLFLALLASALAACSPVVTPSPAPEETSATVDSSMPVPGMDVMEKVVAPESKLRAPSFDSQAY